MDATTYHLGGFLPDLPHGNLAELWSAETGTYTAWDDEGNETESRPLTDDEAASLVQPEPVDPPPPLAPEPDAVAAARADVESATTIPALTAALLKVLDLIDPNTN